MLRVVERALLRFAVAPKRVACNVCGWSGARFAGDGWHPRTICPRCRSEVRHRLLAAALEQLDDVAYAKLVDGKRILHFAPEPHVRRLLEQRASIYETADFLLPRGGRRLDISNMKEVRDGEIDLLVACDVLEHVSAHRDALREIRRVLRAGGCAVFTVPQQDGLLITREDLSITDPGQREREYGQSDHVRMYGDDFPEIVRSEGFDVTIVDEHRFAPETQRRNVLAPPLLSPRPLATNHRKVFFARPTSASRT